MFKYKGEIALFIVAIFWGMGFVGTAVAVEYFSVFELLAIRFWIAALILTILFFKSFKAIDKLNIKFGIIIGTFLFLGFLFQTVGIRFTTPSKNAFLTSSNVVIVPLIGHLFYKRKIGIYNTLGSILMLVGIGCLSYNKDLSMNIGDILTLVGAVMFAFHIFYISEFIKRGADSTLLSIIQLYVVAIYSTIATLFTDSIVPTTSFRSGLIAVVYLGIFSTALAFFLQVSSQRTTSETKTAIILSTEALFGTLFSVLILKEQISNLGVIGCIIIFIAILIAEVKPKFILNIVEKYKATFYKNKATE